MNTALYFVNLSMHLCSSDNGVVQRWGLSFYQFQRYNYDHPLSLHILKELSYKISYLPLARSSKRSAGLTVMDVENPTDEKYSKAVDAGP